MEAKSDSKNLKAGLPSLEDQPQSRRKGILAVTLNGGGISSVVSAAVVMAKLEHLVRSGGKPDFRWSKDSDMLAGTGAGGLLAILIGQLRVPLDDTIEVFKDLSKCWDLEEEGNVQWHHSSFLRTGTGNTQSISNFEAELLARLQVSTNQPLYDEAPNRVPVFVVDDKPKRTFGITRIPRASWPPNLLRSYDYDDDYNPNTSSASTTITNALQATSAFTPSGIFSSLQAALKHMGLQVGYRQLTCSRDWDYSNPSGILVHEAGSFFGYGVRFGLLLCIGIPERFWDLPADHRHDRVEDLFKETRGLGTYSRLIIPDLNNIDSDNYSAVPRIIKITNEYLDSESYKEIIDNVVEDIISALT